MSHTYRVQNPVTDTVVETFDFDSDDDIRAAVERAAAAYRDWSSRPLAERSARARRFADLLEEHKDELARDAALEMGKPLPELIEEAEFSAEIIRYYADHGAEFTADQPIPSENGEALIRHLPLGPLVGIMPWNFPFYQVARFAGPNLVLGNTILLKHAEICPRSARSIERLALEAGFPEGVYQALFATHDQVARVIADPRVRGVSLTGSERAGAQVAAQAGRHLKKVVLELGGTDPYIVLDTPDVAQAARLAWDTRMVNTGQACNSNKRIFVMEDIYEAFVDELVELAAKMQPTTPEKWEPGTYCPLSSREAAEKLRGQLDDAVAQGANLCIGGELADQGAYIKPAVITDIPRGSDAWYEEFFGPVAEVYKVTSAEDAIAQANDSRHGLGGAVFSQDEKLAKAVAARLEVGMANVNTPAGEEAGLPFGGVKNSGFGRELGPLAIEEFANKQLYYLER
ncbi:succinate-semialdehyde dehydrogenase [Corynebacterium atypicum]|uniref:Succinate-semialdehyde dehydrogenase n=1 Tax=Corynebacterium atypicum TaxID=191610 RepID=A0ABM5QNE9_9CORY|nr:aldehyde dehydrogenase family protein [Corynebacterium atypicum]AIG64387.1 succinate-semialdehyde dehydrogenase [Corynebacterium atypicum]